MSTYEAISLGISILSLLIGAYAAFSVKSLKTNIKSSKIRVKGNKNTTAGGDINNAKS